MTIGPPRAPGYPDYSPSGPAAFIPEWWSGKLSLKLYAATVFASIASTEHEDEISGVGSRVHIRRVPTLNAQALPVGGTFNYQTPDTSATVLDINYQDVCPFQIASIDAVQSDIDLFDMYTQAAVQALVQRMDKALLTYVPTSAGVYLQGVAAGAISQSINLGAVGAPIVVNSATAVDQILLAAGQALDEANVPRDGNRWIVLPPTLIRKLKNSDLKYTYLTGDAQSPIRNGILGGAEDFDIYQSNNLSPYADNVGGTTVGSVNVLNAGSGYTSAPTVTLSGGGGTGATATAAITTGVTSLVLQNQGSGYLSAPTVSFTGGGGTGAAASAVVSGGLVTELQITAAGTGYTSQPTVVFTPTNGGTGAAASAQINGIVSAITVTAAGTGYTSAPLVTISGGGGVGATGQAFLTGGTAVTVNQVIFGHKSGLMWASQFTETHCIKLQGAAGYGVHSIVAYGYNTIESDRVGVIRAIAGTS